MTGLDTNILVRYLTQDDEAQHRVAIGLLSQPNRVFLVSDVVLVELNWVLTRIYRWSPAAVAEAFASFLEIQNLAFEDEERLRVALRSFRDGADLPDELIAAQCQECGCDDLATFDLQFVERWPRFAFVPK